MIFLDLMTGFTVGSEGTILKTFDGGDTWYKSVQLTDENLTSISFSDNLHGWVVGNNSVLLKTSDRGQNWLLSTIPNGGQLRSVYFINNTTGWAAGDNSKVFKTTDGGENWLPQQLNYGITVRIHSLSIVDENIGYLCGYSGYIPEGIVFKTTDGGTDWDSIKAISPTEFKSIFFKNSLDGWVTGGASTTIHTTDGGVSWTNVPIGGGNDIFFADNFNGIKVRDVTLWSDISITTDGGETWSQQPIVTDRYLYAAYIIENNYWVAGMGGAILYSNSPIVTNLGFENNTNEFPIEFTLSQNYPNPFNPVTKIKYQIPLSPPLLKGESEAGGFVTLKVYDILGREIATLVNEDKPAGEYEVEFNATDLPSGIYFYLLKAGDHKETKKMVLLK